MPSGSRTARNCWSSKAHLEKNGVEVLGVTDHGIVHSIYFFNPSGYRVELACPDSEEDAQLERLDAVKWEMLEERSRTKRAPKHAASCTKSNSRSLDEPPENVCTIADRLSG